MTTFDEWLTALDERYLADLTPAEVARALRALSSCYVERRDRLARGAALEGAGKRAAFALFYAPQHFLLTQAIAEALPPHLISPVSRVLDLGCGTGAAGAAIASRSGASVEGYDISGWAAGEATWTYRCFGLHGRARVGRAEAVRSRCRPGDLVLAAYTVNELPAEARDLLRGRLLDAHRQGAAVLVVEPIARRLNTWWRGWTQAFEASGGREDEWRFHVDLPPRQRALARAAGLDVRELTARSLLLPSRFSGFSAAGDE